MIFFIATTLPRGEIMRKHFLCLSDFTANEIDNLLKKTNHLKHEPDSAQPLKGKTIGLWFTLPSTRTRLSFSAAIAQLGGIPLIFSSSELQLQRGELLKDTIRAMTGSLDALIVRTENHDWVRDIASIADFPIINALTSKLHPCQSLADIYTIYEEKKRLQGLKVSYLGDGNNVCHSLMIACAITGIHLTVATPQDHGPSAEIYHHALNLAQNGATIKLTHDPFDAIKNADVIYTDVWSSMGDKAKDKSVFEPFQINSALLLKAPADCIVMHCLPAHRGEEITDGVLEGIQSKVWQQAYNRLPTQKALLIHLIHSWEKS